MRLIAWLISLTPGNSTNIRSFALYLDYRLGNAVCVNAAFYRRLNSSQSLGRLLKGLSVTYPLDKAGKTLLSGRDPAGNSF